MTNLPDWLVERVALGEVPPASKARVDAADAAELDARVSALRAQDAAELSAYPPGPAIAQIEKRARAEITTRRRRWMLAGSVATVAAAAVLFVGLRSDEPHTTPIDDGNDVTRVKGSARLLAFRLAGDHAEELQQDNLVRAGDVLQLRYNPGGRQFGMIASIDGAGAVTLHFPATEDDKTDVESRTNTLPNAYALDDAPRFERFFFITANEPIDVRACMEALRTLAKSDDAAHGAPDLPASVSARSLRLRKPASK